MGNLVYKDVESLTLYIQISPTMILDQKGSQATEFPEGTVYKK